LKYQIEHLIKNRTFWSKIDIACRNSKFCSKVELWIKDRNCVRSSKMRSKLTILVKNRTFARSKLEVLLKIHNFEVKNRTFQVKIARNFAQNSKFWSRNRTFLVKIRQKKIPAVAPVKHKIERVSSSFLCEIEFVTEIEKRRKYYFFFVEKIIRLMEN
jgi:hypothetical protein